MSEAKALAGEYKGSRIFKSDNGWYAVVIGPFPARTMDDFLGGYDGPSLPDDSYLARGKNFVSLEWPAEKPREASASKTKEPSASGSGPGSYSLSGDDKWVVIASREALSEAKALAGEHKGSRIFKSDNGWYAVVIGPFPARTMDDFLNVYDGPSLPDDSYLARGKNFVSQEWPVQTDGSVAEAEASDDVKMVQFLLAIDDYDVDEIDGRLGVETEDVIRQYQSDWELTQTGEISPDLVSRLRGEHDATKSRWQKVEESGLRGVERRIRRPGKRYPGVATAPMERRAAREFWSGNISGKVRPGRAPLMGNSAPAS